jgi:hypothetical protein
MGLLDILGSGTPQGNALGQGLLGMGAGLLSGGAYGALGPALGKGLLGFQQMTHQAQQDQIANQYRDMQAQMLQAQLGMMRQRQNLGMNLLGLGPGSAASGAPSAAPPPATNQYGTTAYPMGTPSSAAPQQPSATGAIPPGLRNAVGMDLIFNGGKGISGLLKPNIQNVRPGGTVYDANTGRVQFSAPSTQGTQVTYDANGNPTMKLLPGAAQATADISTAKARGPATYHLREINTPSGSNLLTSDAAVADQIAKSTQANGLPPAFVHAVVTTESRGNPNAVSPAGATGVMQTMPDTLKVPGFGVRPAQNNSPQELTRTGIDYLGAMMQKYKNPTLAAIAYNMGPGDTDKWLAAGGDYSKLPAETKEYVSRVMTRTAVNGVQAQNAQQSDPAGIQVQNEGVVAANTALGKDQAAILTASRKAAISATDDLTNLQQERQAIQSGTWGGTGAQAKLDTVKFLQAWLPGLSNLDSNKVTNTDYLISVLGKGLLTHAKDLGYNPTDADARRIEAIIGTIGKDPKALSNLVDYQEMMANRVIQRHNLLVAQAKKNGLQTAFDMSVTPQTGMPGTQDFKMATGGAPSTSGFKIIGVR